MLIGTRGKVGRVTPCAPSPVSPGSARREDAMTAQDPIAEQLTAEKKERYNYPQVRVARV